MRPNFWGGPSSLTNSGDCIFGRRHRCTNLVLLKYKMTLHTCCTLHIYDDLKNRHHWHRYLRHCMCQFSFGHVSFLCYMMAELVTVDVFISLRRVVQSHYHIYEMVNACYIWSRSASFLIYGPAISCVYIYDNIIQEYYLWFIGNQIWQKREYWSWMFGRRLKLQELCLMYVRFQHVYIHERSQPNC